MFLSDAGFQARAAAWPPDVYFVTGRRMENQFLSLFCRVTEKEISFYACLVPDNLRICLDAGFQMYAGVWQFIFSPSGTG